MVQYVLTRSTAGRWGARGANIYGVVAALISLAAAVLASALARLVGVRRELTAIVFVVVLTAVAMGAATVGGPLLDRLQGRRHEVQRRR